ncbi:MAG: lycopene cyclase domain-containing protein [Anaerolineae bacterium]|nr:lycopene cyclase domain-containing protein [Anaerolineae bacterium]MCA9896028.1 lycopene cyclase domain-containing protein [Anaerolineae bacterium]
MTYFAFLAIFLGIPIAVLSLRTITDYHRGHWMPAALNAFKPWLVLLGLCIVAFLYTTPWDNYLVATSVWWYDPLLVNGLVLGYVPIEEYTFFLVQPIMTGLFTLWLMRTLPLNPQPADRPAVRKWATSIVGLIWLASLILLVLSLTTDAFKPGTYLALELSWALIPVLIQLAFGADILARHWRVIFAGIAIPTLYLSFADAIAINTGTWTIDPAQSTHILLGGILPIEEFVFFLLTNTLVVLGLTLVLAEESLPRAHRLQQLPFVGRIFSLLLLGQDMALEG